MSRSPSAPPSVRFYSLDEANRTLPLVRRIVRDLRDEHRELQTPLQRYQDMTAGGDDSSPAARALRQELDRRTRRLNGYLDELLELGCQFKGFDHGLVDYYSLYQGRPVLLCWKLGEPEIAFWHEIDAGYAGRQAIQPSQRSAFHGA